MSSRPTVQKHSHTRIPVPKKSENKSSNLPPKKSESSKKRPSTTPSSSPPPPSCDSKHSNVAHSDVALFDSIEPDLPPVSNPEPKDRLDQVARELLHLENLTGLLLHVPADIYKWRSSQGYDNSVVGRLQQELAVAEERRNRNLKILPHVDQAEALLREKVVLESLISTAEAQQRRRDSADRRTFSTLSAKSYDNLMKARRESKIAAERRLHEDPDELPIPRGRLSRMNRLSAAPSSKQSRSHQSHQSRSRPSQSSKKVPCQGFDCNKFTVEDCDICGTNLCRSCLILEKRGKPAHECEVETIDDEDTEQEDDC